MNTPVQASTGLFTQSGGGLFQSPQAASGGGGGLFSQGGSNVGGIGRSLGGGMGTSGLGGGGLGLGGVCGLFCICLQFTCDLVLLATFHMVRHMLGAL